MTSDEFAGRMVGVRWERWATAWDRCDCYGLLVLYFREVMGIDLGPVPQTDIASGFAASSHWQQCESAEPGCTAWMAWRDGAPTHCGIVLPGQVLLHAEGSPERPGSVRVSRLSAVERLYGALTFYRYAPTC